MAALPRGRGVVPLMILGILIDPLVAPRTRGCTMIRDLKEARRLNAPRPRGCPVELYFDMDIISIRPADAGGSAHQCRPDPHGQRQGSPRLPGVSRRTVGAAGGLPRGVTAEQNLCAFASIDCPAKAGVRRNPEVCESAPQRLPRSRGDVP